MVHNTGMFDSEGAMQQTLRVESIAFRKRGRDLRFRDPKIESAFSKIDEENRSSHNRFFLAVSFVAQLFYLVLGVLVDGVLLNTWVRIAATLLLVTAFVASCVAPSHKVSSTSALLAIIWTCFGELLILGMWKLVVPYALAFVLQVTLSLLEAPWLTVAFLTGVISLSYPVYTFAFNFEDEATDVVVYALLLTSLSLAGVITHYARERTKRLLFLHRSLLASESRALKMEEVRNHQLLTLCYPPDVVSRMDRGDAILGRLPECTMLFLDVVGFTVLSSTMHAETLVSMLDSLFNLFDQTAASVGVTKLKTIGDCYVAFASDSDQAQRVITLGLSLIDVVKNFTESTAFQFDVRVGIHTGPTWEAVVGKTKRVYDLFGASVSLANEMEACGKAGMVNVSAATRTLAGKSFRFLDRGLVDTDFGPHHCFLVESIGDSKTLPSAASIMNPPPKTGETLWEHLNDGVSDVTESVHLNDLIDTRQSKISLRFESPALEEAFSSESESPNRAPFYASLSFIALVAISDVMLVGLAGGFASYALLGFCFVSAVALFGVLWRKIVRTQTAISLLGALIVLAVLGRHLVDSPETDLVNAPFFKIQLVVVLALIGSFSRLNHGRTLLLVVVLVAGIFLVAIFTDTEIHVFNLLLYTWSALVCLLASRTLEKRRRTDFLLSTVLDQQRSLIELQLDTRERMLTNILPPEVCVRLIANEPTIADSISQCVVLFIYFCGLETSGDEEYVRLLQLLISNLDDLMVRSGVQKVKTTGNVYMAASGLGEESPDISGAARAALSVVDKISSFAELAHPDLKVKVGINLGPVVAGVVGRQRFLYDIFGDTVNIASRMATTAPANTIQTTPAFAAALEVCPDPTFRVESIGDVDVKGKGLMEVFHLSRWSGVDAIFGYVRESAAVL